MDFNNVYEKVKEVPFIGNKNAQSLYKFIRKTKPEHVLELGIAHGTASCYIAAALDENKKGKLTCVDLLEVKDYFTPTIEDQLQSLGLKKYVEIYRMQTGYNWFLHNDIKNQTFKNYCDPKYDLIIIDGPKNWTIDSSSFFLTDKLLKPSGWILWDDYNWTYEEADSRRNATDGISHRSLSTEERRIPHIKEIFHLLVMQHPNYHNFKIENKEWAWAQKKETGFSGRLKKSCKKLKEDSRLINKIKRKIKYITLLR